MHLTNPELLTPPRGTLKFILNESGLVFFPAKQEHRDIKLPGLSYEDDYRGNAVAGLVLPERVDIRYHQHFSDERIRNLWSRIVTLPEIARARLGPLYYQGREIS